MKINSNDEGEEVAKEAKGGEEAGDNLPPSTEVWLYTGTVVLVSNIHVKGYYIQVQFMKFL